jgi:hypothetical protein
VQLRRVIDAEILNTQPKKKGGGKGGKGGSVGGVFANVCGSVCAALESVGASSAVGEVRIKPFCLSRETVLPIK